MTDWTIRLGTQADIPAILKLWQAAASLPTATDSEAGLEALLARDPESLLLAASGDSVVVGSLIAGWDGWRGSFYRLAVHPEWRRRSLATDLVRAGEQRLTRLGAVRLTAIVADDERAAIALWTSAGYSRQAGRIRFIRMHRPAAERPRQ